MILNISFKILSCVVISLRIDRLLETLWETNQVIQIKKKRDCYMPYKTLTQPIARKKVAEFAQLLEF